MSTKKISIHVYNLVRTLMSDPESKKEIATAWRDGIKSPLSSSESVGYVNLGTENKPLWKPLRVSSREDKKLDGDTSFLRSKKGNQIFIEPKFQITKVSKESGKVSKLNESSIETVLNFTEILSSLPAEEKEILKEILK